MKTKINNITAKILNFDLDQVKKPLLVLTGICFLALAISIQSVDREIEKALQEISFRKIKKNSELKMKISGLVKGYPIEAMVPYIARKDKKVAAFLVSIAKKESNWGKRVPVLNGKDCYNYWGYRGAGEKMGSGGHTCFDNPKEAVRIVSQRLDELMKQSKADSPRKMVVWKCGYSCMGHSDYSVNKWIRDVDYYYKKIIN